MRRVRGLKPIRGPVFEQVNFLPCYQTDVKAPAKAMALVASFRTQDVDLIAM
ncbi:hypothetical protein SJA_P1-00720 (plasmid) [Sphingobium indicum UT26S]|uniref:Uncharacterized protein n=1 Tax=Sphingobium indicum (strain DSM 16413 / CCM 7287 / MTCC 6362 / UT26 / NBRC 101211 / UT26S) TaxID=452662 RepID=D4Z8U2_SPHIU|nr:hypothetical protein SJA_P1-00720 [Sphingobium indicum UT26S]